VSDNVISASIGYENFLSPPYNVDMVTIAVFHVVTKGVLVVSSASTKEPYRSSVSTTRRGTSL
jgi:hypothetical protein